MNHFLSACKSGLYLLIAGVLVSFSTTSPVQAQKVAKYGADFLAGGVGGRALGMGGTHVGVVSDVSAIYWNPAGLAGITYPQISYMHAERFAGAVSFDYAGAAFPINAASTVGVTIIRSGVDDIPVTLNAWDIERNQPKPNPENFIERISAADYAFMLSYARSLNEDLTVGLTGKVIRRSIGDFADAWGYSFDVGVTWSPGQWRLGANLQDVSTMLQSWSINQGELSQLEDFGQELPEGGTFVVLPVLRLGAGYHLPMDQSHLLLAADLDVAF
ncbi:MAG: PorV/PorQ family protein, partial [Bacteroidota bacterium]